MNTVVSTFASAADARRAAEELHAMRFGENRVNILAPGASERAAVSTIPTDEGEPPGIGKVMGGVVGGATGMGLGLPLGAVAASALVPGIGPVIAIGAVAGAVLGLIGAAVGSKLESALTEGVPKDDVFFIEHALRSGHTVVIVLADDEGSAETAREVLRRAGGENVDAVRERWWHGVRAHEETAYAARGGSFRDDEALYRQGFECALSPDMRGRTGEALEAALRARHGDRCDHRAFRAGFDRGRQYDQGRSEGERLRRSA